MTSCFTDQELFESLITNHHTTTGQQHHLLPIDLPHLCSSCSPQPKPIINNNYPFSPPTSISTTLVDDDGSPAISLNESIILSSSQPIQHSLYHSIPSTEHSLALRSPVDRYSIELSSSLPTHTTFSPLNSIIDQQKPGLNEKRRKRRESHNAVERRRRDNINDRITELASLLPNCLLDTVVSPNESGMMMVVNEEPNQSEDAHSIPQPKPNKGVILAKSVDYIKHLKHLLELQSQRNTELEAELNRLRSASTITTDHQPPQQEDHKLENPIQEWINHQPITEPQKHHQFDHEILDFFRTDRDQLATTTASTLHSHSNPLNLSINEDYHSHPSHHPSSPSLNHHLGSFESMYYHLQ